MHSQIGGGVFGTTIPEFRQVETGEQILSRAHEDRSKYQVQFIDQPRAKILLNRRHPAADPYVLIFRRIFSALERCFDAAGDEVKGRPAFHLESFARMMRQHKYRYMIRRFLAPPSLP